MNMEPSEFDRLLMGFRIYVRDYEVTPEDEAILAALEEVAGNREVGGQQVWQPDGFDEDSDVDDGGAAIAA